MFNTYQLMIFTLYEVSSIGAEKKIILMHS